MLPQLSLFCLVFTVIAAKPALDPLIEDIEHTKAIQRIESVDKILTTFVQRSTAIQQVADTLSLEAHQSLATLPRECSVEGTRRVELERKNLLANYYKCSVLQILKDVATVSVDSAKYAYNTYKDTTVIVSDVLTCASAGFNPFTFIYCIVKAVSIIPAEIRDIIILTEDFEDILDTFLPRIDHEIESCFNKTSSVYNIYLNDVLEKANLCESSRFV